MTLNEWMKQEDRKPAQIAEGSGIPTTTLWRLLKGQGTLSAKNIARLVQYTVETSRNGTGLTAIDLVPSFPPRRARGKKRSGART